LSVEKKGLTSPLSSLPVVPQSVQYILERYYDISLYKENYDSKMPLSLVESYQRLFELNIHPYIIECVLEFDRIATMSINNFIIKQQQKV